MVLSSEDDASIIDAVRNHVTRNRSPLTERLLYKVDHRGREHPKPHGDRDPGEGVTHELPIR